MDNEEKIILHICVTCGDLFEDYESQNRKFCSRKCYYKSLKEHGKTLYFAYGRKALIHLDNLRTEAHNLGMRVRYWWKTTKKELNEFIMKVLYNIRKKKELGEIDYEYGPRPAYIEEEYNNISPPIV